MIAVSFDFTSEDVRCRPFGREARVSGGSSKVHPLRSPVKRAVRFFPRRLGSVSDCCLEQWSATWARGAKRRTAGFALCDCLLGRSE